MTQVLIGDIYLRQQCDVFWLGYTISPAYTRQGYAIEAITATIDWIKENGFSLIKAGVNPENTLSKKLLIRIGFNFSSIEDGWAYLCSGLNKRRIISRREKPMRPFQAYFNMHSSVSSAFSSKWVGIQFPKYITLFLLKYIPPKTTCYHSLRKYLSTLPEALMLENVIIR